MLSFSVPPGYRRSAFRRGAKAGSVHGNHRSDPWKPIGPATASNGTLAKRILDRLRDEYGFTRRLHHREESEHWDGRVRCSCQFPRERLRIGALRKIHLRSDRCGLSGRTMATAFAITTPSWRCPDPGAMGSGTLEFARLHGASVPLSVRGQVRPAGSRDRLHPAELPGPRSRVPRASRPSTNSRRTPGGVRLRGHKETMRLERASSLPLPPLPACDKRPSGEFAVPPGALPTIRLPGGRNTDEVVISCGAEVIARHRRSYDSEDGDLRLRCITCPCAEDRPSTRPRRWDLEAFITLRPAPRSSYGQGRQARVRPGAPSCWRPSGSRRSGCGRRLQRSTIGFDAVRTWYVPHHGPPRWLASIRRMVAMTS